MQKCDFMLEIASTHFFEPRDTKFAKFGLVELKL
jgi:hypothetical protein